MEKRKRSEISKRGSKYRKRQRLENEPYVPPKPSASALPGQPIRLDKLRWKEVGIPDRMEDYEGFFGLEEIDDIDVVRDDQGKVSFVDRNPSSRVTPPASSKEEDDTAPVNDADEEEWGGFSDDNEQDSKTSAKASLPPDSESLQDTQNSNKGGDSGGHDFVMHGTETEKKEKAKPKEKKPQKKKKKNIAQQESAFDGLEEEALDKGEVDISAWFPLELSAETLLSLSNLKFGKPTRIQAAAVPEIIAGHDVIGKASTGSGKTLAFGIPILESFLNSKPSNDSNREDKTEQAPMALILSPTRELAHQISEHLQNLIANANIDKPRVMTLTGGLSMHKQQRLLNTADIIVGTPGRVWEIISQGHGTVTKFKQIKYLVIDEADRLLSEGHFKELDEILSVLDSKDTDEDGNAVGPELGPRQTLVFSATFHKGLQQKLAGKGKSSSDILDKKDSMEYLLQKLKFREEKPKFIDVNPISQMAERLREGMIECASTEKDLYLYALLMYHPNKRTLVFTNSISAVRRLTPFLQNLNLSALALHSNMPQKARLRSVERFTEGKGSILVATDVAARGLDIPGVQLILHYHLPRAADMYVHRSGRTARAESSGSSILICAPEEVQGVRRLVAKVHSKASGSGKNRYYIRSLNIDRRIVQRLKPRTTLAKQLADTTIAKEKKSNEDDWLREAAEELGVDYDSEEFDKNATGRQGRGNKRKKDEREARALTKGETQAMRSELKSLLAQRINVGVSERYLTSGGVDVEALLKSGEQSEFLGHMEDLGFVDEE